MNYAISINETNVITSTYSGNETLPSPWIGITKTQYASIVPGSTWDGTSVTVPIPTTPTPPTLADQAAIALQSGVTISTTGSLTLTDVIFSCDDTTTSKLGTVVDIYDVTGTFPGGTSTYDIKDALGNWHTLTGPQYKAIVLAIASYVAPLDLIIAGHPGITTLPSSTITMSV